jgi:P-type Cu+ transporter
MANTAIDPVCGMSVETNDAAQSDYRGQTYYFCSDDCKTTFDRNPEQFIRQAAARG